MFKNISNKQAFSLDNACYLVSYGEATQDDIGQWEKGKEVETVCFCAETSAYSNEFFSAGQQGIKPSTVLIVDSESYQGQEQVKYNAEAYSVYRVFPRSDGLTELYLADKLGV